MGPEYWIVKFLDISTNFVFDIGSDFDESNEDDKRLKYEFLTVIVKSSKTYIVSLLVLIISISLTFFIFLLYFHVTNLENNYDYLISSMLNYTICKDIDGNMLTCKWKFYLKEMC